MLQEKYFSPKRTKPSLSIVNPLDVLRQRIMLEMARRQMRENTKQVRCYIFNETTNLKAIICSKKYKMSSQSLKFFKVNTFIDFTLFKS